jgi:hypothetical protein
MLVVVSVVSVFLGPLVVYLFADVGPVTSVGGRGKRKEGNSIIRFNLKLCDQQTDHVIVQVEGGFK